jgi:hypothetical protein
VSRLSRRDLVGLSALGVGLVVGLFFLIPGGGPEGKQAIVNGEVIATATPTVAPTQTPTPLPVTRLPQPPSWYIRYFRGLDPNVAAVDSSAFVPSLDLSFRNAPFNDMQDDNWSVSVNADVVLEPGRNIFSLDYQGKVRVLRDGIEVAGETSQGVPKNLEISLQAETSTKVSLEIQGVDIGGPFSLRWK